MQCRLPYRLQCSTVQTEENYRREGINKMTAGSESRIWRDALQQELERSIPLSRAMQLSVVSFTPGGLMLRAPLAPNSNDKGTAFGGSLSALLTLAGWGWLWIMARREGLECDLLIQGGEIRYIAPVTRIIEAHCPAASVSDWENFRAGLNRKGKARIALDPRILDSEGQEAVTFQSSYVALRKEFK